MTKISTLNTPGRFGLSANMVLFYGAVPVLLGIAFAGLTYPQLNAARWPVYLVPIYSVTIVFFGWLIRDWTCALIAHSWRRRGLSLPAAVIVGALIANVVIFPFNIAVQTVFEYLWVPPELHTAATRWGPLLSFDMLFLRDAIINHILPALFLWTTVSLAFYHLMGLPRYGYPTSQIFLAIFRQDAEGGQPDGGNESALTPSRPSFMSLLPDSRREERIIAVKAEQHYVRIFTRLGEDLIHERFRSVVSDFEHYGGLQVHRSFAINPEFVQDVEFEDGQAGIVLANGLRIPVSRSYTAVAKKLKQSLMPSTAPQAVR